MHQPPLLRALLLIAAVGALGSARTHAITGSTWTLDTVKALVEDVDRAQYTRPLEYMGALQAALERVVGSGPANAGTGSSVAQRAILNTGHGNDDGQLTRGSGAAPSNTGRVVVRLLQRLGDTALFLRRFEDALAYYRDAHTRIHDLAIAQSAPSSTSRELLASHAAIAKALCHAQRWVPSWLYFATCLVLAGTRNACVVSYGHLRVCARVCVRDLRVCARVCV